MEVEEDIRDDDFLFFVCPTLSKVFFWFLNSGEYILRYRLWHFLTRYDLFGFIFLCQRLNLRLFVGWFFIHYGQPFCHG